VLASSFSDGDGANVEACLASQRGQSISCLGQSNLQQTQSVFHNCETVGIVQYLSCRMPTGDNVFGKQESIDPLDVRCLELVN